MDEPRRIAFLATLRLCVNSKQKNAKPQGRKEDQDLFKTSNLSYGTIISPMYEDGLLGVPLAQLVRQPNW